MTFAPASIARLIEAVGVVADDKEPRSIGLDDYLLLSAREKDADASVAVIVAQGTIVDGAEPAGVVAGDTFAHLIREARAMTWKTTNGSGACRTW